MFNKSCQRLDSNPGPLVSEATALPTAPQPLPTSISFCSLSSAKIIHQLNNNEASLPWPDCELAQGNGNDRVKQLRNLEPFCNAETESVKLQPSKILIQQKANLRPMSDVRIFIGELAKAEI